jgi:NitT/TauT family transport system permease protein
MNGADPKDRAAVLRWWSPWALARPDVGTRRSWSADLAVAAGLFALFSLVVRMAIAGHHPGAGAPVSLRFSALPLYAAYSVARMAVAYVLSMAFSLVYGYVAAYNRRAERVLVPILDILQSVPILSFMPAVVLALTGLFPGSSLGAEFASVVLVFTSQAWNLTFSFYNSLLTVPKELREVARLYHLNWWQRFRQLELPYAAGGLVWNSMMSWAAGWFFLMAAEMFSLGNRSFQLPGLGSYLKVAAGHPRDEIAGLLTLVLVIVAIDQLVWRPVIAWADKFKVELVGNQTPPRSAVLMLLRRSHLLAWAGERVLTPAVERLDRALARGEAEGTASQTTWTRQLLGWVAGVGILALAVYAGWRGLGLLLTTPGAAWRQLPLEAGLTLLRVAAALAISVVWTVPVGVFIGMNRVWASRLQPVAQILASVPASALFPVIVLWVGGGLSWLSVLLMLLGSQWYVLFNVIAGAMALPQDLKEVTNLFGLSRMDRWRTLILPGIFPSLITGLITAAGGAWNAAIVTEYVQLRPHVVVQTTGLGAAIAQASQRGAYGTLLAATLALSVLVVLANRNFWRRLYRLAETRYTLLS